MCEYYYIESQMTGMVLDVENGSTCPGTKVSPWKKNNTDAQLWIDDPATGTIRSKLKDYCLDIKGVLVINPYNGSESQKWVRQGDYIASLVDRNIVLDISECNKAARASVISYPLHAGINQKWKFLMSGRKKAK